jgi:hypothetical protein
MNYTNENPSLLTEKILEAEARLRKLDQEIEEIGQPAGQELRRRLDLLKIEKKALKRNFEESLSRGEPDSVRMEKIETLLHHIEREEASLEHAADFLHQAAPSSVTIAVETGAQVVDLLGRGMKRVLGDHHPLGTSVFVNHSHENLASEYGLAEDEH